MLSIFRYEKNTKHCSRRTVSVAIKFLNLLQTLLTNARAMRLNIGIRESPIR